MATTIDDIETWLGQRLPDAYRAFLIGTVRKLKALGFEGPFPGGKHEWS